MYAKLGESKSNARNLSNNKEEVGTWTVVAVKKGEIETPVTVRVWMGRSRNASVVYASLWARGAQFHTSGYGSAGGWGYHKESAAIQEAITSAGIQLFGDPYGRETKRQPCSIDGVGDSAIRSALTAIARALGYRGKIKVIN